jgi:hypothetical protein
MDHRWDDLLQAEHRRRIEQGRYGARPIESDEDVARRDQLALARRRANKTPWEIGAAHWDQRDLYTKNSQIEDAGYGRGPSFHPEIGSYAYHRDLEPESHGDEPLLPSIYEREAYPWLNYERVERVHEGIWDKVKHSAARVMATMTGRHEGVGPQGWRRSDDSIREDVCEALTHHPSLDATEIEVTVKDSEVTLEGTVRDRPSKHLAETLCERCRGVEDVHNHLTVRKNDDDVAFTAPIVAM